MVNENFIGVPNQTIFHSTTEEKHSFTKFNPKEEYNWKLSKCIMLKTDFLVFVTAMLFIDFMIVMFYRRSFRLSLRSIWQSIIQPWTPNECTKFILISAVLWDLSRVTANSFADHVRIHPLGKALLAAVLQVPPTRRLAAYFNNSMASLFRQILGPVYILYTFTAALHTYKRNTRVHEVVYSHLLVILLLSSFLSFYAGVVCRPDCDWTCGWGRPSTRRGAKLCHGFCMQVSVLLNVIAFAMESSLIF